MEKKFTIDQKSLLTILSSMQPICSKRTALEATSSVLFNISNKELILKSTDLEISLQASCPLLESPLTENQSFLVSGKRIFEIVKELEGPIHCSIQPHQLELHTTGVHLSLNIKDNEEFPPFPERIENLMQLDALLFLKMLDNVAFLIPQSNANPALNGLLLEISPEILTMTTTDGHCLAQISTTKATLKDNHKWLLPRRAVFELKKILETSKDSTVFLGICDNQLVFSGESFNFFTKLLADPFPHYQPILSKEDFFPAIIEKTRLTKTLRRSACLLSGQFIATKFAFTNQDVTVSLQNKEVGNFNEKIPVQCTTPLALDIRFYAPYILSGLQSLEESAITFYLKNSTKPVIFESHSDNYSMTYLVMPVSPSAS